MSKWDELRKILDDAEKAEAIVSEGERSSPPKSVKEEIWKEMQRFQPVNDTDPWRRATAALAEAVEWIEKFHEYSESKIAPMGNSKALDNILSILNGKETREIPK